jgi:retron-type reverse transcriptase
MKRHGHLFEQSFTREALLAAFHAAAKSKHGRRACFAFERNLGAQIDALHRELHTGTYQPRPYYTFTVYEPKTRLIYAPAFRDCVVQHALYAVVGPIFDRTFSEQSFACRRGYGTHQAADYAQAALQQSPRGSYTLKLDIRKFFYRIDRAVLRRLIERKIKDARLVTLLMTFADHGEPVGVPIGNLLSQLFALLYLNPLDQFVKRVLKVARYCRYVDDFVLFGLTRARALDCRAWIIAFLRDTLHIELSKSTIARVTRGVNFVGYRTWASRRFVRRRSCYNYRHAVRRGRLVSAISILGHARRTHSLQHLLRHSTEHAHAFHRQLPQVYRFAHLAHAPAARGS